MPLDNSKLKKIYETLKSGGYKEDYNTFVNGFAGNDNYPNRKKVYDLLRENGASGDNIGNTYEEFMKMMQAPVVKTRVVKFPSSQKTAAQKSASQKPAENSTTANQQNQKSETTTNASNNKPKVDKNWKQKYFYSAEDILENTKSGNKDFSRRIHNGLNIGLNANRTREGGLRFNPSSGKLEESYIAPSGNVYFSKYAADAESHNYRDAEQTVLPMDMKDNQISQAQKSIWGIIGDVWNEAEKEAKRNRSKRADEIYSNSNLVSFGGPENRLMRAAEYTSAKQEERLKALGLQKLSDAAWSRVGNKMTKYCYEEVKKQYPDMPVPALNNTANTYARWLVDNAVYKYAVRKNTPKSSLEYFAKTAADMNVLSSLTKGIARMNAGTAGDLPAYEQAMSEYGKNHRISQIAGTVVGMGLDPVTWISGGIGSWAGKKALNIGGRLIFKNASTNVAGRLFGSTLGGRVTAGIAGGAANFGAFEGMKEAERQFVHGGHINEETGENEGYSLWDIGKSTLRGNILGSITGSLSPLIGNVADKAVKATNNTAGKVGIRFGKLATSTVSEGTIFSVPEWISGNGDAMDVWTDNMSMMLGFKANHMINSAPRVIAGLRPIEKPRNIYERNHNRMSFMERLRKQMDASPADLAFTKVELDELRNSGYGELSELFQYKPKKINENQQETGEEKVVDLSWESKWLEKNPEFDGYDAVLRLMEDKSVSQNTRAKAYYMLTKRQLPMGTVAAYSRETDEDGNIYIVTSTADGEVISRKRFDNKESAKREEDYTLRQIELNSVDVGERYSDKVAWYKLFRAAVEQVTPRADLETARRYYEAVKNGDKVVISYYGETAEAIDRFMQENSRMFDNELSESIRLSLSVKTGVDVDEALKKVPSKRTKKEQSAVEKYIDLLFNSHKEPESNTGETFDREMLTFDGRGFDRGYRAEGENRKDVFTENKIRNNYESNEAVNGVVTRINDDAEDIYTQYVEKHKALLHPKDGNLHQATLKEKSKDGTNKQVFIIDGNVVMTEDGKSVDAEKSDKTIVIYDTETGEKKQIDPSSALGIQSMDGVLDMNTIMQQAEDKKQQYIQQQMDNAQGKLEVQPGQRVVMPNGEEAVVTGIFEDGGVIASTDDGRLLTASHEELQRIADEKALADYRERHGIIDKPKNVTDTQPVAESKMSDNAQGAPAEYKGGMTLTIRDEDGTEKEAMVIGRVRTVNNNGKLEYELDENGGIVQYVMDGEVHRDRIQDLNEKVFGYTANEKEQQAAQTDHASNVPREYKQGDRFMVSDGRETFDAEIIAEENEDGLLTVQFDGNGETFVQRVSPTDLGAWIDTYISQAAEVSEHTDTESVQQKYKKGDTLKIYDGEEAYEATIVDGPNEEGLIPVRVKGKNGDYIQMFAPQTLDELTAPQKTLEEQPTAEATAAQTESTSAPADAQAPQVAGNASTTASSIQPEASNAAPTAQPAPEAAKTDNVISELSPIPVEKNKKGKTVRMLYHKVPMQRTLEDLYDGSMDQAEIDQYVDNYIDDSKKRLENLQKKEIKIGTNKQAYLEAKKKHEADLAEAQAELAYYENLKQEVKRITQRDARNELTTEPTSKEPLTLEEAAANFAAAHKVTPESIKAETGMAGRELNKYVGLVAKAENGGITIERMAEMLTESQEWADLGGTTEMVQDARNMLIEAFRTGNPRSYARKQRELYAEREQESELQEIERYAWQAYHMTAEEFLAYEEQALPAIIQKYAGFDFEKYYASLQEQADRQAREFEINNNPGQQPLNNPTNNEQPTESTTDGAGSQVLPREESSNQPREANAGQPEAGRPEGTGNDGLQSPVSQGPVGEGAQGGEQTKGNVRVDDGRGGDGSPAGRQPSDLAQAEEINYQLSDEVDENGHQFVLNSDGKIEFGRIGEDTGLTQAPILLSEGIITNKKTNAGYGLLHIEARHGDQIRAAGYDSVLEFIEEVAKNYEVIRKGNDREGRETYMLQLTDKHNNTLMVELSGDGTYWNINTAGIFKTSYGANRDVVYARHTTDNQPAEADEASLSGEQSGTTPSTRMNAPAQSYQNSVLDNTRDTGKTLMGNGNDTATPENTISSADKGKQNQPQSEAKQEETTESLPQNISEQVKAAEAQTNTNPTEAQKQAGNYKKGHLRIDGFDISIENPKGSVRRGTDASGRQWEQKMNNTYGYLRGTEGVDGDHIDVFLSDDPEQGDIFVIDQTSKDGTFDEHKVMYGFPTEESARQAYLANYKEGWQGLGAITRVSREEFKKWVQSSHRKTKLFAEYKGVKTKQTNTELPTHKAFTRYNNNEAGTIAMVSGDSKRGYLVRYWTADANIDEEFAIGEQMLTPEEFAERLKSGKLTLATSETTQQQPPSTTENTDNQGNPLNADGKNVPYHKSDIVKPVSKQEAALRDALVEIPRRAGMEVVTDADEAQRVLDAENGGVRMQAELGGLKKASDFIISFLQGKTNKRSTKISIPERANRLAEKAIGHEIKSHTIRANELTHAKNRHGISGTANTENSIPLRDEDFALMPYIMSAPTRVVKGSMASNGTESVRYEKDLSNGVVIVVEREGRFDVSDMENITMWAQKKSATNVTVAKKASHSTSETIVISEADAAKIRKDAEDAIRNEEKNQETTDKVRFFRTKDGHAYGFVKDGKIYIDTRTARADTPIHEYTHLWAEAFRRVNPEGWKDIVRLMKGTDMWEQVRRQYPELTAEDELAEEVLAHYSGRSGAERLRAEQERILRGDADIVEKAAAVSAIQRVKEALGKFWRGVADWLGLRFTTAEEVADRVLADMLHGVNPAKVARAEGNGTFSGQNPDIRYQREENNIDKSNTKNFYRSTDGEMVEWESILANKASENGHATEDPTGIRLRSLEEGEKCSVERRYVENGMFDFTGKERIESEADVAYIFRQLENSAVENSFLVLLKDGKPTVIHLGMGDYTSTVAPIEQAFVAYSKMNPDEVYFVHNHPSGNIKASTQDQRVMDYLRKMFGREAVNPGIIINTTSGKFGVFDSDINIEEDMQEEQQAVVPIKVYNFGKQVFASDWNPREAFKIRNSDDVASFISSHRLGEREKMSLLVLSNDNSIVANLFLPFTKLGDIASNDELMAACDLIAGYVHQCGGIRCVVYGNYGYSYSEAKTMERMYERLKEMKAPLLDAIHITHSAREEGIVCEPGSEYVNIDAVNDRFNTELQQQIDGTLKDGHIYQLGLPSAILKSTGVPNLPIQMNSTRLEEKATKYGHDFHLSDVHGLVNALQEPVAVFAYGNKDKAQNIIVEIQRDGKNFVVGISIRPTVNGRVLDINSIRNVFPKDNAEWLNWINLGKLLYADKEKIQTLIDQQRTIPADVEYLDLDSVAKVLKDFKNPSLPSENLNDTAAYRQKSGAESAKAADNATTESKRNTAQQLADKLNTPVRIVESTDEITHPNPFIKARRRRAKGWYDRRTGEVVIVLPNCESAEDVAATVAHEMIAHKGLREMIGEERYDEFLDEVYNHLRGDLKQQVEAEATRAFIDDTTKSGKRARTFEQHRRTATDELLGRMAEKPFEEFTEGERTLWGKIKAAARRVLDKFLGTLKLPSWFELGDNELRYILWRSKERLERGREHPIDLARDIVKREELGIDNDVYAMGDGSETFRERQRRSLANRGTVMPGLNEAEVKVVKDIPRHPYTGNIADATQQAIDAAKKKYAPNGEPKILHYNNYGQEFDYSISGNAIEIVLSPKHQAKSVNKGVHLALAEYLDNVIGESIEVEEHPYRLKTDDVRDNNNINPDALMHRFYGVARIDGTDYRVMTLMKEENRSNRGNGIHSYEVQKIEVLDEETPNTSNGAGTLNSELEGYPLAILIKDVDKTMVPGKKLLDESNSPEEEAALYRDGDFQPRDRAIARDSYNRMVGSGMYQFQEAMQDSMLGLKRLYQSILGKDTRIEDVEGFENAYLAENRMSSVNAAEQHEYYVTFMKPLIAAVGELAGTNEAMRQELTDYMMAKHGLERNEVMANRDFQKYKSENPGGKKTLADFRNRDYAGLTALMGKDNVADAEDAARLMVQDYERKYDTTELWDCVNAATSATLEKIFQSGLLSRENYEQIKRMYKNYIPLRGWDETTSDEVYGYLTSKNGPLGASPIKRAEGRSSKADDPIATIALMADDAIRQGNRNLMKQTFLNFVLNNPSDLVSVGDLWLKYNDITDEWEPVFVDIEDGDTAEDISRKVEAFEARMMQLAKADKAHYKRGRDAQSIPYKVVKNNINEHQVLVRRNGRTYVLTINGNPRAAQALNGLTNPDVDTKGVVGNLLRCAESVNRFISAAYTTRNPDFVVSNFVRDLVYSNCMVWVKEGGEYAVRFHKNVGRVNPWSINKLFRKWNNGNLDESIYLERMFKAFMLGGGETGYTNIKDIEGHKREIVKELKRNGNNVRDAWAIFTKQLDLIGGSVENCARFAAFLTSREMGRSVERSIYDAKEISVNFNKKGSGGKMLGASGQTALGNIGSYTSGAGRLLYIFWNAAIQGSTNFGRQVKRNPKKALTAMATMYILGSLAPILAKLIGGDDEDDKNAYYNLPENVRRSNICLYAGDTWIKIALPVEFRAFYGLGELSSGVLTRGERYSNEELAYQIAGQVSQLFPIDMLEGGGGFKVFVPSLAKPIYEAEQNQSWTGLPIYKNTEWNKNDPEWTKTYQNANSHLVNLSKWANELTGGDDYKKGYIDINPAKIEHELYGYFGGAFSTIDKLVKMGETAFGEREFEWRNMLLANRVLATGDERTENRKLTNEYFKYNDMYEETRRLLKHYEEASETDEKYKEKLGLLKQSEEYTIFEVFDSYKPLFKALYDAKKDADETTLNRLEQEEHDLRREMVDLIHEIEDDKNPNIDGRVSYMLQREFEKNGETRKSAASRIAKNMGGKDTYGSPKTEYGKIYESKRDYIDLAEDVLLQSESKKAKDGGDKARYKRIESARMKLTEMRKGLERTPYEDSNGNIVTEEDVMNRIRTARRKIIQNLGLDK